MHFRETEGPGWSVCSENLYNKAGMASEIQKHTKFIFKKYASTKYVEFLFELKNSLLSYSFEYKEKR